MSLSTNLYGSTINKGIGGLMSGLDTDDLVKQMTAATRNKINRQYQSKQKLLYRQESYREISTKLLAFSNKYFSYASGSKTNILSPKFFESNTFKSSSNYVNVTGNSDNIKNFSIDNIKSVATAASFTSSKKVTTEKVSTTDITQYTSSLAGETFSLEYSGQTYNFSISNDFGKGLEAMAGGQRELKFADIVGELNNQLATMKDKDGNLINENNSVLKYELSGNAEEGYQIILNDESAKLTAAGSKFLDVLKMETGKTASSQNILNKEDLTRTAKQVFLDGNITIEYNGVTKKINLSEMVDKYSYDAEGLKSFLNDKLKREFGEGKVNVSLVDKDNDGVSELLFDTSSGDPNNDTNIFGISSISKELSIFTGLESGDYNRLHKTKSIADLGLATAEDIGDGKQGFILDINGEEVKIESTMSITDVINTINNNAKAGVKVYYSSTTDTFTVKATEAGAHKSVNIKDVSGKGNLATALFGTIAERKITEGTDTEMTYTLNGVQSTITRSTANFSVDEINIELNEKASTIDFTNGKNVTFDVINNSDEVVEGVKKFIEEYNEIINLVGTKISEKPKRDYLPLTPEQQEDMEEEEIKNWNIEAKKGALYGDRKMNDLLRSLRESMSGLTDVSELTLSTIGITSASMDTSGKLVFDEKKFREKLTENPDQIAALFTNTSSKTGNDAKSGISLQLQNILRKNVGSYGTTGLLIDEAGMPNSMTSDKNYISEKITEHDKRMAELKKDLEAERKRYWDQFTALEKSLSRLNTQSSWLTDMMGQ